MSAKTNEAARIAGAVTCLDTPTTRRRLAPNIICLFSSEREPVANERRRGRLPAGIASFHKRPRLMAGDMARIHHEYPTIGGQLMQLIKPSPNRAGSWEVRMIHAPIECKDDRMHWCVTLPAEDIVRVSNLLAPAVADRRAAQ